MIAKHATRGVIAASLTPMNDDLTADAGMLAEHCAHLLANGCHDIVLLGTTGEANSFTTDERRRILESIIARGASPDRLIVGAGCCASGDSVNLCRHALSVGVTRVLLLPPFYYKGVTSEGIYAAFARVLETANEPDLRAYLYVIPQMTGVEIDAELVERLVAAYPRTIAGLKESSGDWPKIEAFCKRFGSRIDVLVGNEIYLRPALAAGAAGCVTASGNVAAGLIRLVFENGASSTGSHREQQARDLRLTLESVPLIAGLKEFTAYRTGDARWRNVRPPLTRLAREHADIVVRRVRALLAGA